MIALHPIALLFPEMEPAAYTELKESMRTLGQIDPAWYVRTDTGEEQLIDGRHRARACEELGIELRLRLYEGPDPVGHVVALNMTRRHLTPSQTAMVGERIATLPQGRPKKNIPAGMFTTRPQIAKALGVGLSPLARARRVLDHGAPEVVKAVDAGALSLNAAEVLVKASHSDQAKVMELPAERIPAVTERMRSGQSVAVAMDVVEAVAPPPVIRLPLPERLAQIRAGVEAGLNPRQIAEQIGTSRARVLSLSHSNGIDLRIAKLAERQLDHARVIERISMGIDDTASSINAARLNFARVSPERAHELCAVVSGAMKTLRHFHTSLKLRAQE